MEMLQSNLGTFGDLFDPVEANLVLDAYGMRLRRMGYHPERYPDCDELIQSSISRAPKYETLCHAAYLCSRGRELLRLGRYATVSRWIGLIQGILLMNGVYSLTDLTEHAIFGFKDTYPAE